jgi:flagellar basal-body rod modification protein FlgD
MPISGINGYGAAASSMPVNSTMQMNPEQFLKMMVAELSNQNPMEPMNSTEFLTQLGQINNLQMVNDLSSTIQTMLLRESIFQAGSLLDKMIEYVDENGLTRSGIVQDVRVDSSGQVQLGMTDGAQVSVTAVRRVLSAPAIANNVPVTV